ncbi:MAG: HTTM domain-containing protein, partial [Candidatus Binatia bacterium]
RHKREEPQTVPFWQVFVFRALMFFVYFFGGIAKLNCDWLKGEPMRTWLAGRAEIISRPELLNNEFMVYLFSLGGTYFDLFIGWMLLWPPTRLLAFLLLIPFHLFNSWFFEIGIFPWLGIAATTLFVEPGTPRRWWNEITLRKSANLAQITNVPPSARPTSARTKLVTALVFAFLLFHVLMPMRHFLYPGNVNWTEEGQFFSWRMKLRDKKGTVAFIVKDQKSGDILDFDPKAELTEDQFFKMPVVPQMIVQYAHHLQDQARSVGYKDVTVRARAVVSMNGRAPQDLIDPSVDLTKVSNVLFEHGTYIIPLETPLVNRHARMAYYLLGAAAGALSLAGVLLCGRSRERQNRTKSKPRLVDGILPFSIAIAVVMAVQALLLLMCG